jgi:MarR-like DNA-binding transcriptional regulator SgrR of sgrS sRNA
LIETRIKEHHGHICLYHPEKSAVAEHSIKLDHQRQVQYVIFLAKKSRQMDQIMREVTEIELHPNNMDREDSFSLSWAWKPLIHDLKEWRQSHAKVGASSGGPRKELTRLSYTPHTALTYPPFI